MDKTGNWKTQCGLTKDSQWAQGSDSDHSRVLFDVNS